MCCHGVESALNHFLAMMDSVGAKKEEGGKRKGQMKERHAAELFSSHDWEAMLRTLDGCVHSADSHPKVTVMCQLVLEHFAEHGESTRVMIFSTYRESVAELTGRLGKVAGVRPAIFVGQAKGKG